MAEPALPVPASLGPGAVDRPLVRLAARNLKALWGLRAARLYGIGVGVSYGFLALLAGGDPSIVAAFWKNALTVASWAALVGGVSLAADLDARDDEQGVAALVRLRGRGARELSNARAVAATLRLSGGVTLAGFIVIACAALGLRDLRGLGMCLVWLLGSVFYGAFVGTSVALLARTAGAALPTRGRWLYGALVLVPWLFGWGSDHVPSVPGVFAWVLHHLPGANP